MKKQLYIMALLAGAFVFVSCQDGDWDVPEGIPYGNNSLEAGTPVTIAELQSKYANVISSDVFKDTSIKNWEGFKKFAQGIGTVLLKTGVYMTATQFASLIPDVMSFADLSSYANVYSQSMAATKEGGQYSNFENAGSGSFAWPNWIVSNALDIYPGATLAAKGSLNVSGATRSDMALLGGLNNNILGGDVANVRSHDVAVGGTFLFDSFITENSVNIHRGAALLSSADITAATFQGAAFKRTATNAPMALARHVAAMA